MGKVAPRGGRGCGWGGGWGIGMGVEVRAREHVGFDKIHLDFDKIHLQWLTATDKGSLDRGWG